MYPNLYYFFKDWFGVEWSSLKVLNVFGLMVALAFVGAAWVLALELKRKEKQGLLIPREETVVVGKPASLMELISNGLIGFLFGYKFIGVIFSKAPEVSAQEYIFSKDGSFWGGLLVAAILAAAKWYEKNKRKLKTPEYRPIRIWPHDRVGDIVIIALLFGILGAKLFDAVEHWDDLIADPVGQIFSASGLTFYGGLIVAAIAVCWYAYKKGIKIKHLLDAAAPALMLAYAIGRIGCQVAGDGDWGIFNSAYISNEYGKVATAFPGEYEQQLKKYETYFLQGKVNDSNRMIYVTDRTYATLATVPHKSVKAVDFLPVWLFAYTYPKNVNADGILIPGDTDEHNRVLPQPVFPTPLYETILCGLIFIFLWAIRRKISTPLVMFGIYLILNGLERFLIETIRVNKLYNFLGMQLSQAEMIALGMALAGIGLVIFAKSKLNSKS
ncbi:MAG: prolipoprotein diacylglyceryl transferase [Chitinophagaceae bacterium]|nr:prolipoprotein diacylglyceryl transferase [Chitinophagaceae bacterium]